MISIIICSIDPIKYDKITQNYKMLLGDMPYEIIGIHDAKSLCEAYNRGINKSSGDILIFSHDDIEILSSDFTDKIQNHLINNDIVGLAGTVKVLDGVWTSAGIPYLFGQVAHPDSSGFAVNCYDLCQTSCQGIHAKTGIKMLDGLFFAVKRNVVQKILFDEQRFDGFHCYDADFTFSAYLAGFQLAVCNDIAVIHYSHGNFDAVFQKYNQRFISKHENWLDGNIPRIASPNWKAVSCPDKAAVLSSYSPEAQNRIYLALTEEENSQPPALSQMQKLSKQTPIHDQYNPDLLKLIPINSKRIIEVGCSSGALAKAYRQLNPNCEYFGTEIDPDYAEIARQHCREVLVGDIEQMLDEIKSKHSTFDCWIFGDVLEHLYDPWYLLKRIASDLLDTSGVVLACIPNMQYWQMQFALNVGNLRYQDSGLLDRTHIRWFTRITIIEMFAQAGLNIEHIEGRVFEDSQRDVFMPLLRDLAEASGGDPDMAVADATPFQWVVRASHQN